MISQWIAIGGMSLATLTLHLMTNALYGFHRDSLYYLDSARHPAWGYVDYPPITPAIARLSLWIFGPSVWGLRLWPSLAGAAMVVLVALIARELGGGATARVLAALAAATSPVFLAGSWLFQTVAFDQVTWLVCLWLAARLVRTGDLRLWIPLGAAAGIGLETKYTIFALIAGLGAGLVLTPVRRQLRTRWPWIGLALMLVIFLPNLYWQAANGWPSLEFVLSHRADQSGDFSALSFLAQQPLLIGPLAVPLWIVGWYWLLSNPATRFLALAAAVPFVIFLLAGKSYYVGPVHPFLIAAGCCAVERIVLNRRAWIVPATATVLVSQTLVLLPISMPVMPEAAMATSPLPLIRKDFGETVGWGDLVREVGSVYYGLPAKERGETTILAANYGEAGAIDTLGPAIGLPRAASGELSYYFWPPESLAGPVIAVGFDSQFLAELFSRCSAVGTVSNAYGLRNQEYGAKIEVCSNPTLTNDDLWKRLKSFQ
jgi:dolichyl-phosphate-mannose-protein mannosyltransferase